MATTFAPRERFSSESYSSALHAEDIALFVCATEYSRTVRLAMANNTGGCSMVLPAEQARLLAAELIAAADSVATVAEAA
jgi:hypothetical protein